MADILLTCGIDISSLKAARSQIDTEIKTWKFPPAEKVIPTPKIDPTQMQNLENYKQATIKIGQAGKEAGEKIDSLTKATEFSRLSADSFGESISSVGSELKKYYSAIAGGKKLTEDQVHRMKELENSLARLSIEEAEATKGLKGLFKGLDIGRLMLWAVGWTALYSIMRGVANEIVGLATNIIALNDSLGTVRAATNELGTEFDEKFSLVRKRILEVTAAGIVPLKDMAEAFKILTFEGMKTTEALLALEEVRQLSTVTGEKAVNVAQSVAEVYGLWKDRIRGATTEAEKMNTITNFMAAAYTKTGITVKEFQQTLSKMGVASRNLGLDLEYVVKVMIFLDNLMVGTRQSSSAMRNALVELVGDTKKLNQTFGISARETDNFQMKLFLLEQALQTLGESEFLKRAVKIFPDIQQAEIFIEMLKRQNEILGTTADIEKSIIETEKKRAQGIVAGINKARTESVSWYSTSIEWLKRVLFMDERIASVRKADIEAAKRAYEITVEEEKKLGWNARQNLEQERKRLALIYERYLAEKSANEELAKYRKAEEQRNEERKRELAEQARIRKEFAYTDVKITDETKAQIAELQRSTQISILEAANIDKRYIAQQKIENLVKSTSEEMVGLTEQERKGVEALLQSAVASKDIVVATQMVTAALGTQEQAMAFINELQAQRLAMVQEDVQEMMSFAAQLESLTAGFVKNLMAGTANFKDFLSGVVDLYRETFAQKLVQIFGEETGIFAEMASAFMGPLQKAHYSGIKTAVPLIIQAHIDGITAGMAGATAPAGKGIAAGVGGAAGGFGAMTGFLGGIATLFGGRKPLTPEEQLKGMPAAGQTTGAQVSKLQQAGKLAGQALGAATAIYGGVQGIMAQRGAGAGMGALGGALSGMQVGAMFGGVGAIVGGVVGAIGGAIMGGKKKSIPDEIRESTIEIKSAIQLSNKELSLISRNTEGMKKSFEGFVMSRSMYFAERMGVEERFALARQRGLL